MSQPRIPAQPSENWGPDVLDALAVLRPPGAPVQTAAERAAAPRPNSAILGTFSWHPELAKAWFLFNGHLQCHDLGAHPRDGHGPDRLAASRRVRNQAQRVRMAKGIGMSDAEVDAISEGPDSPVWGSFDSALLRAVDQLSENRYIDNRLWARAVPHATRSAAADGLRVHRRSV